MKTKKFNYKSILWHSKKRWCQSKPELVFANWYSWKGKADQSSIARDLRCIRWRFRSNICALLQAYCSYNVIWLEIGGNFLRFWLFKLLQKIRRGKKAYKLESFECFLSQSLDDYPPSTSNIALIKVSRWNSKLRGDQTCKQSYKTSLNSKRLGIYSWRRSI
jgi:hypothetical protein